ncbi:dTDP-4-dehydrorhamnose 3,5-epimerase family protein [Actinoplanes sp. NBRC 103695]|uniref:dTDP-4-dehydrorhamnose 3,5-epimerase family protein n=1 Tax=Actinoplanes sp. NBRC 103695 TaxID=3032202 RepID=UPI0024A56E63|nr:dTDP-4-dehydrorhamnose 3,5-epimerase family protein [Actinoplanes sp. NBRC 103695]GLZ00709.1 dTDP-4-dehydrorhamnose 3,5-epimerase [Actinoplanes sp. NBRC 103695]
MSEARKLAVQGALEFTPDTYADDRGLVANPFEAAAFEEAHGRPLFPVAQTIHSRSRRGVVRGMHYTVTPPGMAKYAYCAHGAALYLVADIRVGSPTFGDVDAVRMDQESFRSIYLPVGVSNGFVALTDDTVIAYLISKPYVAADERAVSVLDPALGLPIPGDLDLILADRDRTAITLAEAKERGELPDYEKC